MSITTVNLVSTPEKIREYHPDARDPRGSYAPGIMSADFPIDPTGCSTKLGAWLASHVSTTRFDDDASRCQILLPVTEEGLEVRELGQQLSAHKEVRSQTEMESVFSKLESWIAKRKQVIAMYGTESFRYRVIDYRWTVFGSSAADAAYTPEQYFDLCARQIRKTGGVILTAGLSGARLPDSLAETMASDAGGGLALMKRYNAGVKSTDNEATK